MKNVISPLFILIILMVVNHCSEEPTKPKPPVVETRDTIMVSIEQVTHRSISLRINHKLQSVKDSIALNRLSGLDTFAFEPFTLSKSDTVFIDDNDGESLTIATEYSYFAYRLDSMGLPKDTSNFITARTLPPTSHDFTWTEYTLGPGQLFDVWGTDADNVYAVGGVSFGDSTVGIVHWNGVEWSPVTAQAGGFGIFGFSDNDIWVVSGGPIFHFDGNTWSVISDNVIDNHKNYRAIWGTSGDNLYFGNDQGKIIHWDGEKGKIVFENENFIIQNISGNSDKSIWAIGHNSSRSQDFVVYFNGDKWLEDNSLPINTIAPNGVVSFNKKETFICGNGVYFGSFNNWKNMNAPSNAYKHEIFSFNTSDIFAVGSFGYVAHHNGLTWKYYDNIATPEGGILYSGWAFQNSVFIVGYNPVGARILIGKKQEGT